VAQEDDDRRPETKRVARLGPFPNGKSDATAATHLCRIPLPDAAVEAGLLEVLAQGPRLAEVAEELDRPQSFVSKVETGERRIDPTELEKFARLYGKPITYFLGG